MEREKRTHKKKLDPDFCYESSLKLSSELEKENEDTQTNAARNIFDIIKSRRSKGDEDPEDSKSNPASSDESKEKRKVLATREPMTSLGSPSKKFTPQAKKLVQKSLSLKKTRAKKEEEEADMEKKDASKNRGRPRVFEMSKDEYYCMKKSPEKIHYQKDSLVPKFYFYTPNVEAWDKHCRRLYERRVRAEITERRSGTKIVVNDASDRMSATIEIRDSKNLIIVYGPGAKKWESDVYPKLMDRISSRLKSKYGKLSLSKEEPAEAEASANEEEEDEGPVPSIAALTNLGNTCFLNSVLQVLRYTPEFVDHISQLASEIKQTMKDKTAILELEKKESTEENDVLTWTLINYLMEMFVDMNQIEKKYKANQSNDITLKPEEIMDTIEQLNPMFEGNLQQDAHELLRCLLAYVQDAGVEVNKFRKNFAQTEAVEDNSTAPKEEELDPSTEKSTTNGINGHNEKATEEITVLKSTVKLEMLSPKKSAELGLKGREEKVEEKEITEVNEKGDVCNGVLEGESAIEIDGADATSLINGKPQTALTEKEKEKPLVESNVADEELKKDDSETVMTEPQSKTGLVLGRGRAKKRTLSQTESSSGDSPTGSRVRAASVSVVNGASEPSEKRRRGRSLETTFFYPKQGKLPNPCVTLNRVSVPKRYGLTGGICHSPSAKGDVASVTKTSINGHPEGFKHNLSANGIDYDVKVVLENNCDSLLKQPLVKKPRKTLGISRKACLTGVGKIDHFFKRIPQVVLDNNLDAVLDGTSITLPKEEGRDLCEEPYSAMEMLALQESKFSSSEEEAPSPACAPLEVNTIDEKPSTPKKDRLRESQRNRRGSPRKPLSKPSGGGEPGHTKSNGTTTESETDSINEEKKTDSLNEVEEKAVKPDDKSVKPDEKSVKPDEKTAKTDEKTAKPDGVKIKKENHIDELVPLEDIKQDSKEGTPERTLSLNPGKINYQISATLPVRDMIEQTFQGSMALRTRCSECENFSERREDYQDVSVPVRKEKKDDDDDDDDEEEENTDPAAWFLSAFEEVERLKDDNKYFCEKCKRLVEAERSMHYITTPQILTLHLKRFAATSGLMGGVQKLNDHVTTPFELPCMSEVCKGNCDKPSHRYELFALIAHAGISISSGHYVAFIRVKSDTCFRVEAEPGAGAGTGTVTDRLIDAHKRMRVKHKRANLFLSWAEEKKVKDKEIKEKLEKKAAKQKLTKEEKYQLDRVAHRNNGLLFIEGAYDCYFVERNGRFYCTAPGCNVSYGHARSWPAHRNKLHRDSKLPDWVLINRGLIPDPANPTAHPDYVAEGSEEEEEEKEDEQENEEVEGEKEEEEKNESMSVGQDDSVNDENMENSESYAEDQHGGEPNDADDSTSACVVCAHCGETLPNKVELMVHIEDIHDATEDEVILIPEGGAADAHPSGLDSTWDQDTPAPDDMMSDPNNNADPNNNLETGNNVNMNQAAPAPPASSASVPDATQPAPTSTTEEAAAEAPTVSGNANAEGEDEKEKKEEFSWIECDDDFVQVLEVSEFRELLAPGGGVTPYMLFFKRKQDDRPAEEKKNGAET